MMNSVVFVIFTEFQLEEVKHHGEILQNEQSKSTFKVGSGRECYQS